MSLHNEDSRNKWTPINDNEQVDDDNSLNDPLLKSSSDIATASRILGSTSASVDKSTLTTTNGITISYDDILQAIGYGRFQYILLLVCGLAVAADAVEIQAVSFVLPSACDLHLTDVQKGWLTAIIFIGMMVGGYVWGGLADIQGRRNILRYAMFVNGLFGLVSAFSPNFAFFAFCRFMSGLG